MAERVLIRQDDPGEGRIELEPFRRLDRPTTRALEMEAERLLELYRY
jgi:hypothetical protein